MFFKLLVYTCTRRKKQPIGSFVSKYFHIDSNQTFNLSATRLKHFFKQRCLHVIDGHTCVIADCPICVSVKTGAKLYVNKTTGKLFSSTT